MDFLDKLQRISSPITTGTVIAILDNQISSKKIKERYFASVWLKSNQEAEEFWDELIEHIGNKYEFEIKSVEYPAINRSRPELTIGDAIE